MAKKSKKKKKLLVQRNGILPPLGNACKVLSIERWNFLLYRLNNLKYFYGVFIIYVTPARVNSLLSV